MLPSRMALRISRGLLAAFFAVHVSVLVSLTLSLPGIVIVSHVDARHRLRGIQPQPRLLRHDFLGEGSGRLYVAVVLKMLEHLQYERVSHCLAASELEYLPIAG